MQNFNNKIKMQKSRNYIYKQKMINKKSIQINLRSFAIIKKY